MRGRAKGAHQVAFPWRKGLKLADSYSYSVLEGSL